MERRTALHRAIRAIREAKGMTQGQVAAAAFISSPHLVNLEAGRRPVNPDLIPLLAAALGCEIDAISYIPERELTHA